MVNAYLTKTRAIDHHLLDGAAAKSVKATPLGMLASYPAPALLRWLIVGIVAPRYDGAHLSSFRWPGEDGPVDERPDGICLCQISRSA